MSRYELFSTPHRALRYAFGTLITKAGATDFAVLEDVQHLHTIMNEVFSLVYSHSHHEDEICFAELDARCGDITQHDRSEHTRMHNKLDELLARITGIVACVTIGQDETKAGRELYSALCDLSTEMYVHMNEEERDTQPLFWQYMTDEELMAFEPRIIAAMSPDVSMRWMKYILPSHTHNERVSILQSAKTAMPLDAFNMLVNLSAEVISVNDFQRLENDVKCALIV